MPGICIEILGFHRDLDKKNVVEFPYWGLFFSMERPANEHDSLAASGEGLAGFCGSVSLH